MNGKLRVLIVEDSVVQAEAIQKRLEETGLAHVVAICHTEDSGIEVASRERVELAIVDLQLAQGTGFGVIRHLRDKSRFQDAPICIAVLTNHAVPALKVSAFEAGADYFLDKGKDWSHLPALVAELHGVAS